MKYQGYNLSSYVPKANLDHTKSGQGAGISTLDHSATTPSMCMYVCMYIAMHVCMYVYMCVCVCACMCVRSIYVCYVLFIKHAFLTNRFKFDL